MSTEQHKLLDLIKSRDFAGVEALLKVNLFCRFLNNYKDSFIKDRINEPVPVGYSNQFYLLRAYPDIQKYKVENGGTNF
jgi:hypothetical protein